MKNKIEKHFGHWHRLTWLGMAFGIFVIVMSSIRWFAVYPDYSTLTLFVGVGLGIISISYIYQWMKEIDLRVNDMREKMEGYAKYFMEKEFK